VSKKQQHFGLNPEMGSSHISAEKQFSSEVDGSKDQEFPFVVSWLLSVWSLIR
jgi:hypothetical protein